MNEYDVRRLALVLSVQAEIEGMKAENEYRRINNMEPAYNQQSFNKMANKLYDISNAHNEQLF